MKYSNGVLHLFEKHHVCDIKITSDRPILIFFITDTDYLYVYVPDDNRYAEPIFIYCYKVHK